MKAPVYYRRFDYDKGLIPNKYLASLEDGVCTIEEAKTKTGFTIGYPGWNLVYDMVLSHLHPEKYNIILETGTNAGCTTIILAQALKDSGCRGKVYTIELDRKSYEIALTNFEKAGVSDFIEAVNANSHDFLKDFVKTNWSIRIAFLDASHLFDDVVAEFEAILPSLAPQSLVIFDNTYQIAEENEDQRVNGAIREILKRHGGNLVNFEIVSWSTPGIAIWQKSPFDCVGHQYDKGEIACGVETQGKDRIVGLYSQAHELGIGGNYAQALELYDRIIADAPELVVKTPQINYERALCLKALGRIDQAEKAIHSCLSVRGDEPEFLRFLSEIKSMRERASKPKPRLEVKPAGSGRESAEQVWKLCRDAETLLPLVKQADMERALRAICLIEGHMIGRWCGDLGDKLLQYLSVVQVARATGSKTIDSVEIGTLFGGSCLIKLLAMRDLGVQGKVVCIDPMSGFYDQTCDPQTGLAVTAEVFFENIERFGFTKEAVDLRQVKSSDPRATEGLREGSFATLLIDGDHSYRGVRYDWENYYRFVRPGGIVLFDDYSEPEWPEITVFACELIDSLRDGWRKLGHLGTTMLLSRSDRQTEQVSQEPRDPKPAQAKLLAMGGVPSRRENMLAILDPEVISRRVDLINELAQYGINHLTKSPALGWNYVLDHVWITEEIERYLTDDRRRNLTILDVGCGRTKFHNFLEKKFGVNVVGIDRPLGYCHLDKLGNVDYHCDFLELEAFAENSVDIIYWLSAIEHNEKEKIRQLFQKSMSLLKEGGLFLATFAISKNTHWFEQSEQTNLSVEDSMDVFEEAKVDGNFDEIREKYRKNLLFLRDKYERRYKRFGGNEPEFIVGAVKKIKAKTYAELSSPQHQQLPSRTKGLENVSLEQAEDKGYLPAIRSESTEKDNTMSKREGPIVVYQMGKVGSISVYESLKASGVGVPIYHVHYLTRDGIEGITPGHEAAHLLRNQIDRGFSGKKWRIVSSVREPIARNISAFFQNIDKWYPNFNDHCEIGSVGVEELIKLFLEKYPHDTPLTWFDSEMKSVFGIDVFAYDFPKSEGYKIYRVEHADLLLMRLEDMNERIGEAFKEFLDIDRFALLDANVSSEKEYRSVYQEFVDSVILPDTYVERMYNSKYARHFYSDEELNRFKRKWTALKHEDVKLCQENRATASSSWMQQGVMGAGGSSQAERALVQLQSVPVIHRHSSSPGEVLAASNTLLAEYRDKHRGQRCVIIGNGPSLNKMDLSFLKNEITFGMNRIYLLCDKWDFRPTYYVSVNPLVIEQSVEQIRQITAPRFLTLEGLRFIGTAEENIFIQRRPGGAHFSTDPRNGCWWPTVTYAAMQLAYFMGFNEVILIGVDHYFKTKGDANKEIVSGGVDEDHFHPDYFGKGVRWNLPDLEKSELAYRLAKQAFEAPGRRIIDATVDGRLTIFPKADYREIFFPAAHQVKSVKAGLSAELVDTEFEEYLRNRSESTEPLVTAASAKFSPMDSAEPQERYLVSAIVSTYNSERFFRGCLEDLEHQTIADRLEIIVVNSGSQQNEEAIVKEFQQKYDNIVYIKTEEREGIYAAWNRAVKAARAKFITNANTDDRHREDALEIMGKTLLANPDVALVYGDQICTDTPNGTFDNHHAIEMARRPDYSRARLLFGCCVGSQPMWRKSLHDELGYFDESLDCAADWDFWIRISRKYGFLRIPEFLGLYYYNKQGIEHGREIHSLYERYIVGRRYGTEYIAVIPYYRPSASDPLVSVIMTVYNCAEYIGEAIESVLIQNYPKFELVIINDGSTDNTKEVISRYDDERIRYIYQENGGMSNALNRAIREAKGQYIMPLDADDMMTPDFIASHLQEFKKYPEADLVYSDVLLIDSSSNPIRVMKKPEYQDRRHMIRDLFRAGHPIIPFRLGIRKSVYDKIGLYDEKLRIGMDYDMIRRFVRAGLKEHHLRKPLHLRRILAQSLSRSVNIDKAKDHFEVVKRFTDTFAYDELFPDVQWEKIRPENRRLHAKCLAAVTCLAIGQSYVNNNSVNYAKTAFGMACSQLNDCLEMDPGNRQVGQLLHKSECIMARCDDTAAGGAFVESRKMQAKQATC